MVNGNGSGAVSVTAAAVNLAAARERLGERKRAARTAWEHANRARQERGRLQAVVDQGEDAKRRLKAAGPRAAELQAAAETADRLKAEAAQAVTAAEEHGRALLAAGAADQRRAAEEADAMRALEDAVAPRPVAMLDRVMERLRQGDRAPRIVTELGCSPDVVERAAARLAALAPRRPNPAPAQAAEEG